MPIVDLINTSPTLKHYAKIFAITILLTILRLTLLLVAHRAKPSQPPVGEQPEHKAQMMIAACCLPNM